MSLNQSFSTKFLMPLLLLATSFLSSNAFAARKLKCSGKVEKVYFTTTNSEADSFGFGGTVGLFVDLRASNGQTHKIGLCGVDGQNVSQVVASDKRCKFFHSTAMSAFLSGRTFWVEHTWNSCDNVRYITSLGVE